MTTEQVEARRILGELEALGNPANVAGMARYGIHSAQMLGVPMPALRDQARRLGRNHDLAAALWDTGVLEARIVAGLIEDPARVTRAQMERWAGAFDSWALCDGICNHLFDRTRFAWEVTGAWTRRDEEYVKRAGFVLMATLAVHDKRAGNDLFLGFLPVIEREADDGRNFVKKAVNWALRQVGKRNAVLNRAAVAACRRLLGRPAASARWIAADALRELTSERTLARFRSGRSPLPAAARSRPRPPR